MSKSTNEQVISQIKNFASQRAEQDNRDILSNLKHESNFTLSRGLRQTNSQKKATTAFNAAMPARGGGIRDRQTTRDAATTYVSGQNSNVINLAQPPTVNGGVPASGQVEDPNSGATASYQTPLTNTNVGMGGSIGGQGDGGVAGTPSPINPNPHGQRESPFTPFGGQSDIASSITRAPDQRLTGDGGVESQSAYEARIMENHFQQTGGWRGNKNSLNNMDKTTANHIRGQEYRAQAPQRAAAKEAKRVAQFKAEQQRFSDIEEFKKSDPTGWSRWAAQQSANDKSAQNAKTKSKMDAIRKRLGVK